MQSRRIFTVDGPWPALYGGEGGGHGYVAFAQNQRDEVRDLNGKAGALAAEPGMKQQTFICMATQQGGAEIRTDDKAPTITAAAGMSGNNQPVVCYESAGFKAGNGAKANGIGWEEEKSPTLAAAPSGTNQAPTVCIKEQHLFENHSQDTRYKGPLDVCPMLPAQLGTGGNNQPFVVEQEVYRKGTRPHSADEAQKWESADIANTLNTFDQGESRANELVVEKRVYESHPMDSRIKELEYGVSPTVSRKWHKGAADTPLVCEGHPIYCIDGDKIGKAERSGGSGLGVRDGDKMYTLTAKDAGAHAVAYAMQGFGDYKENDVASGLKARDYKDATDLVVDVAGVDCRNGNEYPELYPTLQAKPNGGQSLNFSGALRVHYIVRRLTPTECARLQGFPDTWGHITPKEDLTDEEYKFWHEVRNTHAAINGKQIKLYNKQQMLTWYNKLHTDSAEYKMWGNGIALPTALYFMQGIADALNEEEQRSESAGIVLRHKVDF